LSVEKFNYEKILYILFVSLILSITTQYMFVVVPQAGVTLEIDDSENIRKLEKENLSQEELNKKIKDLHDERTNKIKEHLNNSSETDQYFALRENVDSYSWVPWLIIFYLFPKLGTREAFVLSIFPIAFFLKQWIISEEVLNILVILLICFLTSFIRYSFKGRQKH